LLQIQVFWHIRPGQMVNTYIQKDHPSWTAWSWRWRHYSPSECWWPFTS